MNPNERLDILDMYEAVDADLRKENNALKKLCLECAEEAGIIDELLYDLRHYLFNSLEESGDSLNIIREQIVPVVERLKDKLRKAGEE